MFTEQSAKTAINIAMRLLARREYSVYELKNKLRLKSIDETVIFNVIAYLKNQNYQSDLRCAVMLLRHGASSSWGPNKIKANMADRGLGPKLVEEVFANHENYNNSIANPTNFDYYWSELAKNVAIKKFTNNFDIKNNFTNKVKLQKFLYSSGFELNHIDYVLDYFCNDSP